MDATRCVLCEFRCSLRCFGWGPPTECLAWPAVERGGDGREILRLCSVEVGALSGSTGAAARWCSRWCHAARGCVDRRSRSQPCVDPQLRVLRHLGALVPGERSLQLLGQRCRSRRRWRLERLLRHGRRAAGPFLTRGLCRGPPSRGRCSSIVNLVVRSTSVPIAELPSPKDQIAFPVTRDGAVLGLGGSLADHDLRGDELLAASSAARPRHPQRPAGAKTGGQLAAQRTAALHVERLVDRLMGDPHRLIIREV